MNKTSRESASSDRSANSTELVRIDVVEHGSRSEHCVDLTGVPASGSLDDGADLALALDLLAPLRHWLEVRGAFTRGSGVLVRVVHETMRPEDLAEEMERGGTVVDTRWLETSLGSGDSGPFGT